MKNWLILTIAIIAVGAAVIYISLPKTVHYHANFLVYINGLQENFSGDKYMSSEAQCTVEAKGITNLTAEEKVHLHDNIGTVVHVHAPGVTWGLFFQNIGVSFNSTCIGIDGNSYCNNGNESLRMYVNGNQVDTFANTLIVRQDRVLITYGPISADVSGQISAVPSNACIYDGSCPERGTAPPENCGA